MSEALRGSCLCGEIAYSIHPPFSKFAHCHCERCRKSTGAAHASNIYIEPSQLIWTKGATEVSRFDLASARSFAPDAITLGNCSSARTPLKSIK